MRVKTENRVYEGYEQILEANQEIPVDTEYNLPDYCADIQKILKCIVTPEVTSAVVIGDGLSVDGTADIRVLYLDAKGECVRGFDTKKEFSFTMRLNKPAEGASVSVKPSVQHLTCRAMNARRVDIHAALGFAVTVTGVQKAEIAQQVLHDAVETRCEQFEVSRAMGGGIHTFILEENIDLQSGKPPVETLLRRQVRYKIEDVQVRDGEVTIAGKACVEVLYRSFADRVMPEHMLFELPFSQTVDCAGADDTCTASVSFVCGECNIQPREDSVGEYTVLNIYLKPTFQIRLTKPDSVCAVCDAFSVQGALAVKYTGLSMERMEQNSPRQIRVRETVRIPEGDLERVLDIWCDGLNLSAFTEKDSAVVRGKFGVCVLYQTKEKRIAFTERLMDFTDTAAAMSGGKFGAEGEITSVRFAITDASSLEITVEIQIREQMRNVHSVRVLEHAELDETAVCDDCCAAVYYATAGEHVWDIAKRYKARVETLRKHNDCTADMITEDRPMLICRR